MHAEKVRVVKTKLNTRDSPALGRSTIGDPPPLRPSAGLTLERPYTLLKQVPLRLLQAWLELAPKLAPWSLECHGSSRICSITM